MLGIPWFFCQLQSKAFLKTLLEAGRVDGANTGQIFFKIVLPTDLANSCCSFYHRLIGAMKIFDIVLAMTGGNYNTTVLAQTFYLEYFITEIPEKQWQR